MVKIALFSVNIVLIIPGVRKPYRSNVGNALGMLVTRKIDSRYEFSSAKLFSSLC